MNIQDLISKYWWALLGGLLLLYVVASRGSSGGITQVAGNDQTTLALAQMASTERQQDLDRQYGFAQNYLNYNLQSRQVDQIIPLAKMSYDSQAQLLASQQQLAQLSFVLQQNQIQQQAALQNYAIQTQAANQRRQDWFGLIGSGLSGVLGLL